MVLLIDGWGGGGVEKRESCTIEAEEGRFPEGCVDDTKSFLDALQVMRVHYASLHPQAVQQHLNGHSLASSLISAPALKHSDVLGLGDVSLYQVSAPVTSPGENSMLDLQASESAPVLYPDETTRSDRTRGCTRCTVQMLPSQWCTRANLRTAACGGTGSIPPCYNVCLHGEPPYCCTMQT